MKARPILSGAIAAFALLTFGSLANAANEFEGPIKDSVVPEIRSWISNPAVIAAITEQNAKHSSLAQEEIDAMDQAWRAETKASSRPMITAVLESQVSGYLRGVKDQGQGIYTEIFVMDNRGLNVGQSDVTSDYWQGDEAKWQKTYQAGADAMLIDEVEFDESTQIFQSQVSLPVVDPASGSVIGAVTVGVNVEALP